MVKQWATAYVAAAVALAGLDAVWLITANNAVYRASIGAILSPGFRPAPAIAFYALYLVGVVAFAVLPALSQGRWRGAAWRGALLGLVCYATYDLTNQATLVVWPLSLSLIDMTWGMVLTTTGATAGFFAARAVRAAQAARRDR